MRRYQVWTQDGMDSASPFLTYAGSFTASIPRKVNEQAMWNRPMEPTELVHFVAAFDIDGYAMVTSGTFAWMLAPSDMKRVRSK